MERILCVCVSFPPFRFEEHIFGGQIKRKYNLMEKWYDIRGDEGRKVGKKIKCY